MPVDDGPESCGQIDMRFDDVEFAGFDQRRDGPPVLGTGIVPRKESVFVVQSDWADSPLDGVVVHFDPTIGEKQAKAGPVVLRYISTPRPKEI